MDAITTIHERGKVLALNPATAAILGYDQAELSGQNVKMLMPSPYQEEHDGYLQNYLISGVQKIS